VITASTLGQAGSIVPAWLERESRGPQSLMTHLPCTHGGIRGACPGTFVMQVYPYGYLHALDAAG
jgi:hypothetical protein